MGLRKILMLPVVVSISAVFAFGSFAQQEDSQVNDKVRELQEQYRRLLKDEYNPSTIEPKTNGKPSFGTESGWMKSSKKKGKKSAKRKSGKKKSGTRKASKKARWPKNTPRTGRENPPRPLQKKPGRIRHPRRRARTISTPRAGRENPPRPLQKKPGKRRLQIRLRPERDQSPKKVPSLQKRKQKRRASLRGLRRKMDLRRRVP